jgi:hypothetical protein
LGACKELSVGIVAVKRRAHEEGLLGSCLSIDLG